MNKQQNKKLTPILTLLILMFNLALSGQNIIQVQFNFIDAETGRLFDDEIKVKIRVLDNSGVYTDKVIAKNGGVLLKLPPNESWRIYFEPEGKTYKYYIFERKILAGHEVESFDIKFEKYDEFEYIFWGRVFNKYSSLAIPGVIVSLRIGGESYIDTTSTFGEYEIKIKSDKNLAGFEISYNTIYKDFKFDGEKSIIVPKDGGGIQNDINLIPNTPPPKKKIFQNYNNKKGSSVELNVGLSAIMQQGEVSNSGSVSNIRLKNRFTFSLIWLPFANPIVGFETNYSTFNIPIEHVNLYETLPGINGETTVYYHLKNHFSVNTRFYPFEFFTKNRLVNQYVSVGALYVLQKPDSKSPLVESDLQLTLNNTHHVTYLLSTGLQMILWNNVLFEANASFYGLKLDSYTYQFNYFGSAQETNKKSNSFSSIYFGFSIGYRIEYKT